jgi:tRNA-(ms[2]io[6]A)-hydroxylase
LAHEETSHVVQVAALIAERGWVPRGDLPNQYARALLAEVRGREPERLLDALLVAAFIEARSHERLGLLARGFSEATTTIPVVHASAPDSAATRVNRDLASALASVYRALATAEERHAQIFLELAEPLVPARDFADRLAYLSEREAEILAALPHLSRVH